MVVGVTCIVATAGAATPLVIAGAVAGGGTVLFGGAEIIEGGQNAYYGSIGDMNSAAFNPIRDTVFLGNQGVYDNTKNVFVFAAGAMIPIGSAYTAGTLTLRSGSVIVAEELLSEGAGFLVTKAGEAMDLNPTATMLLSIAASMGTSAGLGKLDQAYNISGSFPKIDVTTTNPANMMGDVDETAKPYTNSRPSFRKNVVEEVWENAKGEDGLVRDPNTKDIINWNPGESRKGVWDMGHIPEEKYSDMHEAYMNGELTTKEFVDWYNDPNNYRPELPGNNQSHKYE